MYEPSEVYDSDLDCDDCVDYRQNLRCCRDVSAIHLRLHTVEASMYEQERRLKAIEEALSRKQSLNQLEFDFDN